MVSRRRALGPILFVLASSAACASSKVSDDASPNDTPEAGAGGVGGSGGGSSGGGGTGGSAGSTFGGGSAGQSTIHCDEGSACYDCPPGQGYGITRCSGGVERCVCEACPLLEVVETPASGSCGGDPTGTWRLADIQTGTGTLYLPGGQCDVTIALDSGGPTRMLLDLRAGGEASTYASEYSMRQSWSEACATSRASNFSCGEVRGPELQSCTLACDTCTCSFSRGERTVADTSWETNGDDLGVDLLGLPEWFQYCVTGDRLQLREPGVFVEFERVYLIERIDGCSLGDFGVVPGCDFVDGPMRCAGEPLACETREQADCDDGCEWTAADLCIGGEVACDTIEPSVIDCYTPFCDLVAICMDEFCEPACQGTARCGDRTDQDECDYMNAWAIGYGASCAWRHVESCAGTPLTACSEYSLGQCEDVAGCYLEPDE